MRRLRRSVGVPPLHNIAYKYGTGEYFTVYFICRVLMHRSCTVIHICCGEQEASGVRLCTRSCATNTAETLANECSLPSLIDRDSERATDRASESERARARERERASARARERERERERERPALRKPHGLRPPLPAAPQRSRRTKIVPSRACRDALGGTSMLRHVGGVWLWGSLASP